MISPAQPTSQLSLARSRSAVSLPDGHAPHEAATTTRKSSEVIAPQIRSAAVQSAAAQARKALRWLRKGAAKRFFWKYCSSSTAPPG